ncbi:hypothetical protein SLEP1_g45048 [Rubroshorea leprosula]|uniref:alpha-1,2-Mannosidase n=1 Tax=Rubroshorea leprosula TaxID=152421 RepID=A0AAV5LJV2_9ROSI|nr:hypothetical protein SLEP1_g45048 [Rubroshorea leprosula]
MLAHSSSAHSVSKELANEKDKVMTDADSRLPTQLSPIEISSSNKELEWIDRQQKVKEAFSHAWSGYKKFAMGYDEFMPLSQQGVDVLGGLGATIVDALDTSMIMGLDEVVSEAGLWIESDLSERISRKHEVSLFETTIRVLGGLLSAYHLSSGDQGMNITHKALKGPKPIVYLDIARNLADHLLSAFTSSPTTFTDVVLHESSAHGRISCTAEVSTLQLEFNYLSTISDDLKYCREDVKQ